MPSPPSRRRTSTMSSALPTQEMPSVVTSVAPTGSFPDHFPEECIPSLEELLNTTLGRMCDQPSPSPASTGENQVSAEKAFNVVKVPGTPD